MLAYSRNIRRNSRIISHTAVNLYIYIYISSRTHISDLKDVQNI